MSDPSDVPAYLLNTTEAEDDDAFHRPDKLDQPFILCSLRGLLNVGSLVLLFGGILALFIAYPILAHFRNNHFNTPGYNIGGINGSGQVADLPGMQYLLDNDTPDSARKYTGTDGRSYDLVFSDEFNVDGRSFYPGDNAYWEGQDFHYWFVHCY